MRNRQTHLEMSYSSLCLLEKACVRPKIHFYTIQFLYKYKKSPVVSSWLKTTDNLFLSVCLIIDFSRHSLWRDTMRIDGSGGVRGR